MKTIKQPDIKQEDICDSFNGLKYKERVIEKSNKYKAIISNIEKSLEDEIKFQKEDIDYATYMKKMYSSRFSNKQYKKIYKFYQKIREQEKYCPYCNVPTREISQVDHYLPKSKFPALTIVAKNLVPICKDCNEKKGDYYSLDKKNQLIHPYYDIEMIDVFEYIECNIIEKNNIGFEFKIKKLNNWSEEFYKRVVFHFKKLGIDKIYLSDFVAEYDIYSEELKRNYVDIKSDYGEQMAKDFVKMLIKRKVEAYYDKKIMPWRYAGFKSLLKNEWFWETFFY